MPRAGLCSPNPVPVRSIRRERWNMRRNKSGIFNRIPTNQTHNSCFSFQRFAKPGLGFPGIPYIRCPAPNDSPLSQPPSRSLLPTSEQERGAAPRFGSPPAAPGRCWDSPQRIPKGICAMGAPAQRELSPSLVCPGQGVPALTQPGNPGIPYTGMSLPGLWGAGGSLFGSVQNKQEHGNRESWDSDGNGEGSAAPPALAPPSPVPGQVLQVPGSHLPSRRDEHGEHQPGQVQPPHHLCSWGGRNPGEIPGCNSR